MELVEYILRDYEYYHVGRISDFIADFRSVTFCKEVTKVTKPGKKNLPANVVAAGDISQSDFGSYIVKSQTLPGVTYEIDPQNCTCSCPAGQCGAICKHMVGVHIHTECTLFSFPPVTEDERNKYPLIAYGHSPQPGYYSSLVNLNKLPTASDPTPSTSTSDGTDDHMNDLPVPSGSQSEEIGVRLLEWIS